MDADPAARSGDAGHAFVFPSGRAGTGLSNMVFLMLLRLMERGDRDVCALP
jgi:hypothetical protein